LSSASQRILFVTGKLAEPALRRIVSELAPKVGFDPQISVLPITVAALLTTDWVNRHIQIPSEIQRILLPGFCRGDLSAIHVPEEVIVQRGPKDLRDLPEFFGTQKSKSKELNDYDIEILAEINHAPQLTLNQILDQARHFKTSGANIIDLGCNPGQTWVGIGETVKALVNEELRVSVDSFNPKEVEDALANGAELVLSVNSSNLEQARQWQEAFPKVEVVAIPDTPSDLDSLDRTIQFLSKSVICFRVDPIIEPIGFGFAASLGRYIEVRRRYPDAEIMMGIGNLTELTDVDSAGINVLLAGFCQELGIRSVLTTEVINWCRSAVKEFDLARKLVYHAIREKVLPKHLEPNLVLFRDPKLYQLGEIGLQELAQKVTDRNYRIFVERGEMHIINGLMYLHGTDPFELFQEMQKRDPKLDSSHSFYLGYEMAKAVTALTLGKNYTQDQALRWGWLTIPEKSHRGE
jgi:dihydropteroate synthase-like protein